MTLRNIAAASLAALALAACGDDDDDNNTKPITPDTPATPEACKAMKCVYQTEGDFKGSFVAKNEKGEPIAVWDAKGNQTHKLGKDGKLQKIENKPEPGKTAGEFDLSGEGVTEPLKEPVRGGSNYLRGSNSTFDVKASKTSISSIATYGFDEGNWNDAMNNFVAVAPNKDQEKKPGTQRALFEKILDKNKTLNDPANVFTDPTSTNTVGAVEKIESYAKDLPSTIDMGVTPATAPDEFAANGSFNYKKGKDYHPAYLTAESTQDDAWNQEETAFTTGKVMSGLQGARLYGAKVNDDQANIMRVKEYSAIGTPLSTADESGTRVAVDKDATLPTAVKEDTLKFVQFGRLSGLAEPGELKDVEGHYVAKDLKQIPFAGAISNAVASGGVSDATDFYFARGNKPTALDKMKAISSGVITYHGQALTYGIDNSYHGPQQNGEPAKSDGSVPNSTKEVEKDGARPTLLGGRGNFVVAKFAPDQGKVQGNIYNVWNVADISVFEEAGTGKLKYRPLKKESDGSVVFNPKDSDAVDAFGKTTYMNVRGYKDNLIAFSGAVNGNQIVGDAIRYDNEKGKFAGAFFGDKAEEMAGVISSSVKYNGAEPNAKWGAVFGAKAAKFTKPGEDLPGIPGGPGALGWSLERK